MGKGSHRMCMIRWLPAAANLIYKTKQSPWRVHHRKLLIFLGPHQQGRQDLRSSGQVHDDLMQLLVTSQRLRSERTQGED